VDCAEGCCRSVARALEISVQRANFLITSCRHHANPEQENNFSTQCNESPYQMKPIDASKINGYFSVNNL
jgi:hypothetical protein